MGGKSKKRRRRKAPRRASGLSDHLQDRKLLKPPLRQIDQVRTVDWQRDVLPDMLWLLSLITQDQDGGLRIIARIQDVVQDVVTENGIDLAIDGRMSSWERVPEPVRPMVVDALRARGLYDVAVPHPTADVLSMYPAAPGAWIIQGVLANGFVPDLERANAHLNDILVKGGHGQDIAATRAKLMSQRALFNSGKVSMPPHLFEDFKLLANWPNGLSNDDRLKIESIMRASFGSMNSLEELADEDLGRARREWAQMFWRENWRLFPCDLPEESLEGEVGIDGDVDAIRGAAADSVERVLRAAQAADPDLYDPDRYEIMTGLALRGTRLAVAAATIVPLWHGEFGSPIARSVVESLIVFRWLEAQAQDRPALYREYKDFGRGRLKLLKLHVDKMVEDAEDPDEELIAYAAALEREVNQDLSEEFQDIDLGTFGDVPVREMAKAINMDDEYKLIFAPMSSDTHGEWPALDRYVLQRCRNGAHRGHRVPRRKIGGPIASVVEVTVGLAQQLADAYETAFVSLE